MPKLQSNFTEITLRHGCSPVNLLHIFRTLFSKNTSKWLQLEFVTRAAGISFYTHKISDTQQI